MIIDSTYFTGEILIAGLDSTPVQDSVALYIGKYEPEYLEKALGYTFAKLFSEGLAADSPEQRWLDLRDGAEYTNCHGHTKKWTGLANDGKQSPIANYIYSWLRRDGISYTATAGEMQGKTDNATTVSPDMKVIRAWNEMVKQTEVLHDFLLHKKEGGTLIYHEFAIAEVDRWISKRMNVFGL